MQTKQKCIALIVAAGHGVRAGEGPPKQYRLIAGVPVLRRTVLAFLSHPDIDQVHVVISPAHRVYFDAVVGDLKLPRPIVGGGSRQESVRLGLEALSVLSPSIVLIHDAARPLVSRATISATLAALETADGALPVSPSTDTLKKFSGSRVEQTLPRDNIGFAQTPQGFHFEKIMNAHRGARGTIFTDDASIAEAAGLRVAAVAGQRSNFKLTTQEDFVIAEALLAEPMTTRTGMGFDVHRFGPGDHVWLCGVQLKHTNGLVGHSDADAGLHALTDALLGAACLGDIGDHFPPGEEKWRGAPSHVFLSHAASLILNQNGSIEHVDVTLICEQPKIAPHREAMKARIGEILSLDVSRISVKATTTEGLGFTGRNEGVAAQAIATVRLP